MLRFPCGFHPPYCFGIAGKCLGTARVTQQTAAISAVSITQTYQRFGQVRRPSSQRPTGNGDSHHLSNPTPAGKPDIAAVGSGKDIVAKSTSSLRERASTAQKNHFNSQLEVLCQPLHLFFCGGWDAGGFATNRRSCDDSFGSGGGRRGRASERSEQERSGWWQRGWGLSGWGGRAALVGQQPSRQRRRRRRLGRLH